MNYLEKTTGDNTVNLMDEDSEQDTGARGNIFPNLNTVLPQLSSIENMVANEAVISKEFYDMYETLAKGLGLEPAKQELLEQQALLMRSNPKKTKKMTI